MKEKNEILSEGEIMRMEGNIQIENDGRRLRFLENLMTRKQEVEEVLRRLIEGEREYRDLFSGDEFIEELDQAEQEISKQTYYVQLERKNKELEKIQMLVRMLDEDEDFGICEDCGQRIPEERLFIVPEATRCVPCQQEEEKWELRINRSKIARDALRKRGVADWEAGMESDDEGITIKVDTDGITFTDMEETELIHELNGNE